MAGEPAIELDENDILNDVDADETATPESSPEETKEDVAEAEEPEKEEAKESEEEDEPVEPVEEPKDEQPEFPTAEARKEQLSQEIRTLANSRSELKREIESLNAQKYHVQSPQELVEQGMDPVMARVEASEQRAQMAEYNAYVAETTASVNTESLQVMQDFPIFDSNSPEFNPAISKLANDAYQKVAGLKTDENGLITQVSVLPYPIYKSFAEAYASGGQTGKVNGQRSAEKMLANADTPSSSAPKEAPEDPFIVGLTKGLKT